MLVKAMEVSGIEGNFRSTCENVMQVLRTNKDSVMAMMEVYMASIPLTSLWLSSVYEFLNDETSVMGWFQILHWNLKLIFKLRVNSGLETLHIPFAEETFFSQLMWRCWSALPYHQILCEEIKCFKNIELFFII